MVKRKSVIHIKIYTSMRTPKSNELRSEGSDENRGRLESILYDPPSSGSPRVCLVWSKDPLSVVLGPHVAISAKEGNQKPNRFVQRRFLEVRCKTDNLQLKRIIK